MNKIITNNNGIFLPCPKSLFKLNPTPHFLLTWQGLITGGANNAYVCMNTN